MNNLAFVFPGQGSQSVGMLTDLYQNHQIIRDTISDASTALNFDLAELILKGPEQNLNRTDLTQPALLASSVAIYRLWQQQTAIKPSLMAGHSLGEYSALVCSGAMAFDDALKLVESRGKFMLDAVPEGEGAMAAILGLDNAKVEQCCKEAESGEIVSAVNYNSPGQIVIAGTSQAVDRAMLLCKEAGAKRAIPLAVTVPSHCLLMKPAADKLEQQLAKLEISTPEITVINNVDVAQETSAEAISSALVRQLYNPVRWSESIKAMQDQGITTIFECGPGKVLAGLCKRLDRNLTALVSNDQANFNKSMEALK